MKQFDIKKIFEWLSYILKCPVCGHRYDPENAKIIESKDDKFLAGGNLLLHTDCEKCKSSVVFSIAIDGPEIYSIGMVTDLTSQDTNKFRNASPISPDEVLNVHSFLSGFDGDFRKALK